MDVFDASFQEAETNYLQAIRNHFEAQRTADQAGAALDKAESALTIAREAYYAAWEKVNGDRLALVKAGAEACLHPCIHGTLDEPGPVCCVCGAAIT